MSLTNDIAYGFTITLEQAESLKCDHGLAKEALASDENEIIIKGTNERDDIKISQKELSTIIEARMKEIFHLAKSEIRKYENEVNLNFGIVITGGGSKLKNIKELEFTDLLLLLKNLNLFLFVSFHYFLYIE